MAAAFDSVRRVMGHLRVKRLKIQRIFLPYSTKSQGEDGARRPEVAIPREVISSGGCRACPLNRGCDLIIPPVQL